MQHQTHNPPAFCPDHGIVRAWWMGITNSTDFTIEGGTGPCPLCGKPSEILSGVYSSELDGLNFLLDPSVPREAVEALLDLAKQVQSGKKTPEEATEEAARIEPRARRIFESLNTDSVRAAVIGALVCCLGNYLIGGNETTVVVQTQQVEPPHKPTAVPQQEKPRSSSQSEKPTKDPNRK